MLFIVNAELKMGNGKICAQVGHAIIGTYIQTEEESRYDEHAKIRLAKWEHFVTPKIIFKTDTEH